MAAAVWDIIIEQGATWRTTLTVKDHLLAPVDLTGYTAAMQVREPIESGTVLLSLTSSPAAGIALGGIAGTVVLVVSDEVTAALTWTHAVYDLELYAPGGDTTRLLKGEVQVDPEVTR